MPWPRARKPGARFELPLFLPRRRREASLKYRRAAQASGTYQRAAQASGSTTLKLAISIAGRSTISRRAAGNQIRILILARSSYTGGACRYQTGR
jgi:hypothetical protein